MSALVRRLSPPARPTAPIGRWALTIGLISDAIYVGGTTVAGGLVQGGASALIAALFGWVVFAIPFVLGGYLIAGVAWLFVRERYRERQRIWDALANVYGSLYYCARDDVMFEPGSEDSLQPETARQTVFSHLDG